MDNPERHTEHNVLHVYVKDYGRILSTRPRGKEAAEHLRAVAEPPGDLILDFREVELSTPPFLQEVVDAVQAIIMASGKTGRIVLAVNMNEDVSETMAYVLARKKLTIAYRQGDQVELLQGSPQFAETLREAQRLKPFFTAPELADKLNINPDTAHHRLKKLLSTGAAVREQDSTARQGVRHVYRVATPELVEEKTERELVPA